jgi:hypothetical protein
MWVGEPTRAGAIRQLVWQPSAMSRRQHGVNQVTPICLLVALLAVTSAACSGNHPSANSARVATPPGAATGGPPSASPTATDTIGQRAALARLRAKKQDRLYRRCPNASSAPPPKDASVPVVNVGFAARGRYYKNGQVRPRCLVWSGDGDSDGLSLGWKNWGGTTATADGYGLPAQYFRGSRAVVPAQFRLGDRGYCMGVLEYRRVYERTARSPTNYRWRRWDTGYPLCARRDRGR